MTICPRSWVNCFILNSPFAVVTLLLVPRLRTGFRKVVRQEQEHRYLSTRVSGSKKTCTALRLHRGHPQLHAIDPSFEPTPLACLEGGDRPTLPLWVEIQMWRLVQVQVQEQGQGQGQEQGQKQPWWEARATATLQLHHRQAPEQPSPSWSSTGNCCAHMHSQNQKISQGEFCNMHPWQKAEGYRAPSSTHSSNTWSRPVWSHFSDNISFAPSRWVNIGA